MRSVGGGQQRQLCQLLHYKHGRDYQEREDGHWRLQPRR